MSKNLLPNPESKNVRRSVLWLILPVLMGGVFLFVLFAFKFSTLDERPQHALITSLSALKYPDQIQQAEGLCTQEGLELLKTPQATGSGAFLTQFSFDGNAKASGIYCDVPMVKDLADGRSKIYVRLVNQNGWKFHDIFINNIGKRQANFFLSFALQHPVLATAKLYSGDVAQAAKQAQVVVKQGEDFIDALIKLQKLAASQNPPPPSVQPKETFPEGLSQDEDTIRQQQHDNMKLFLQGLSRDSDPNSQ